MKKANLIKLDRREIVTEELSIDGKVINAEFLGESKIYQYEVIHGHIEWISAKEMLNKEAAPTDANAYVLSVEKSSPGIYDRATYNHTCFTKLRFYKINLECFVDGEKVNVRGG